jgi:hypothetical protein
MNNKRKMKKKKKFDVLSVIVPTLPSCPGSDYSVKVTENSTPISMPPSGEL